MARLKRLSAKLRPPTSARTAPLRGSMATTAACSGASSGATGRLARLERGLAALFEFVERPRHGGLGRLLHLDVDGRVDAQPALVDALAAEALDELEPHLLLEVAAERLVAAQRVACSTTLRGLRRRRASPRRWRPSRASPAARRCGARPRARGSRWAPRWTATSRDRRSSPLRPPSARATACRSSRATPPRRRRARRRSTSCSGTARGSRSFEYCRSMRSASSASWILRV